MLIPNVPDCDYGRGEEPLSEEKVKHLAHTFLKYGVIEKRHESLQTHQKVGHVVESYLLPAPASIKGIDGKTRQYPKGTWIVTAEITDEQTIAETKKGIYTGFSATTLPEEVADNVSFKSSQGLLIKDIPNPVGFAVSLVEKPCVHSAKFCKLKKHSQNEESNMNDEDKQFLDKLKSVVGFKSNEEPATGISHEELKQELASFKSDFKSEIIAGVTQGVAQAVKEALSEPKKKPKKEEGEGEEGEGETKENNTSNNNGDNNSNTEENNTNKEGNDEGNADDKNKKKNKKPPASTKGAKLHDGPAPVSTKSDTQTVYEIMGRNSRGQRIKE